MINYLTSTVCKVGRLCLGLGSEFPERKEFLMNLGDFFLGLNVKLLLLICHPRKEQIMQNVNENDEGAL